MKWWTRMKGAEKYLIGPDADEAVQWSRARQCTACIHLRVYEEDDLPWALKLFGVKPYTAFCGEESKPTDKTCGCGVLAQAEPDVPTPLMVKGRPMVPAFKTTKAKETCWNWTE